MLNCTDAERVMEVGSRPENERGQPGLFQAALSGLCPQCDQPTLFEAPARIALECSHCKLEFSTLERGARLAGMFTALIAIVLIMIAIGIDVAWRPPLWLQVLVWAPVTVGVVVYGLRLFKTALLYRQYEAKREAETPSE